MTAVPAKAGLGPYCGDLSALSARGARAGFSVLPWSRPLRPFSWQSRHGRAVRMQSRKSVCSLRRFYQTLGHCKQSANEHATNSRLHAASANL